MRRRGIGASTPSAWRRPGAGGGAAQPPPGQPKKDIKVMDEESAAALANKARALKEKARNQGPARPQQTGLLPGLSVHGASFGPAARRPVPKKLQSFGCLEDEDDVFSSTVVDPLGEEDLSLSNLKSLSRGLFANDFDDGNDVYSPGANKFRKKGERVPEPAPGSRLGAAARAAPMEAPHGGSTGGFLNPGARGSEEEDEFSRPRSRLKAKAPRGERNPTPPRGAAPATPTAAPVEKVLMTEGLEGIQSWLEDVDSDLVGQKVHLKSLRGEAVRLKASSNAPLEDKEMNIETYISAFEKLQSLHRLLTCLKEKDGHRDMNADLCEALGKELKSLSSEQNVITHGLTPLPEPKTLKMEGRGREDLMASQKDWRGLIAIADKYKDTPVKMTDDLGRHRSFPGGRRDESAEGDDSSSSDSEVST